MTRTIFATCIAAVSLITLSACGGGGSSTETAGAISPSSGSAVTAKKNGFAKYQSFDACPGFVSKGASWSAARYDTACKAVFRNWQMTLGGASSGGKTYREPSNAKSAIALGLADDQSATMHAKFCSAMANVASGKASVSGVSKTQAQSALGCAAELVVWSTDSSKGERVMKIDSDEKVQDCYYGCTSSARGGFGDD